MYKRTKREDKITTHISKDSIRTISNTSSGTGGRNDLKKCLKRENELKRMRFT